MLLGTCELNLHHFCWYLLLIHSLVSLVLILFSPSFKKLLVSPNFWSFYRFFLSFKVYIILFISIFSVRSGEVWGRNGNIHFHALYYFKFNLFTSWFYVMISNQTINEKGLEEKRMLPASLIESPVLFSIVEYHWKCKNSR